jgi:hypothetical protein
MIYHGLSVPFSLFANFCATISNEACEEHQRRESLVEQSEEMMSTTFSRLARRCVHRSHIPMEDQCWHLKRLAMERGTLPQFEALTMVSA